MGYDFSSIQHTDFARVLIFIKPSFLNKSQIVTRHETLLLIFFNVDKMRKNPGMGLSTNKHEIHTNSTKA